jgi:hypothetical protein
MQSATEPEPSAEQNVKKPLSEQKIEYSQRVSELLDVIFKITRQGEFAKLKAALMFDQVLTTIGNWVTPSKAGRTTLPSKAKRDMVLNQLWLPKDAFEYTDAGWTKFIHSLRGDNFRVPDMIKTPLWLYNDNDILREERNTNNESHIIVITDAADKELESHIDKIIKNNLEREVGYTYIIPESCRNSESLHHVIGKEFAGRINIQKVKDSEFQPHRIDYVVLFVREKITEIGDVHASMIEQAFELICRPDHLIGNDYVWIKLLRPKINRYVELLRKWGESTVVATAE